MSNLLKNKVAVVTGAGRGLGRAFAIALADDGAKVVVNDLGCELDGTESSREPANETVAEIRKRGGVAVPNYDTVTTAEGGENIIKTALDNFGRIDILVNNAGVLRDRMNYNMSEEDWDIVIKTHLYGCFHCTKPACIQFRQQRNGRIVSISSVGGGGPAPLGNPGQVNYTSAKGGIIAFSRTIALEMGRYGVTSNVIFPFGRSRMGWSPQLEAAWGKRKTSGVQDSTTMALELMASGTAVPEDIAPLVVYLASDKAANVNACVFHVIHNTIHMYGMMEPIKSIFTETKWTVDQLVECMPQTLERGLVNPAPPAPSK